MHLPGRRRRLQREGERAVGVLVETGNLRGKLLVRYPDGSEHEVGIGNPFGANTDVRWRVGQKLPVRYDPKEPKSIVVDKAEMKAAAKQTSRRTDAAARDRAVRELRGEKSGGDGGPRLDPEVAASDPELAQLVEEAERDPGAD